VFRHKPVQRRGRGDGQKGKYRMKENLKQKM
jgi:hypothetical protein